MNKQLTKYDMRAPPRRRIKNEDASDDQPVFLRKAFAMITSCPPDIGGWSQKGDTVIIKDVKLFSDRVIPTAYKHNNFSSFVRQLNFYGFRKIKSESMEHADWWEFRHPQFLRGEPQLLSDIKRSVHFAEATNVQEVSQLKHQVTDLNDRIAALHEQIDKLTGLVTHMQVKEKEEGAEYSPKLDEQAISSSNAKSDSLKKRKLCSKKETKEPPLVRLSSCDSIMMINEYEANGESLPSGPELNLDDRDFFGMSCDQVESGAVVKMTAVDTPLSSFGNPFLDQNNAADENDDLLNLLDEDSELYQIFSSPSPDAGHEFVASAEAPLPTAKPIPVCATPNPSVASPVHELSSVLESLPDELKLRFVDKLAEFMASQISRSMHGQPGYAYEVCGVHPPTCDSSFASTYPYAVNSNDDSQHYILPSGTRAPEIALPLASAAITAMLSNITQLQHLKSVSIKEEIV